MHGDTHYLVRRPNGNFSLYSPMWRRCDEARLAVLDPADPAQADALYEDVSLAFDAREGFVFMEPGPYQTQAVYERGDLTLYSNILRLWVRYPDSRLEDLIVPTFTDEIAEYLNMWGMPGISGGAPASLEALDQSPLGRDHPLAAEYARCQFMMAIDGYKAYDPGRGTIHRHQPELGEELAERALKATGFDDRWRPSADLLRRLPNLTLCHSAARMAAAIPQVFGDEYEPRIARLMKRIEGRLKANGAPDRAVERIKAMRP